MSKDQEVKSFKVTDKNEVIEAKLEVIQDLPEVESIKASNRTRSHLNGPGATNRTFDSPEAMVKSAESIYANVNKEEYEKDKSNGLDINDIESIKAFKTGYTPMGGSLLVKFIKEEQMYGSIFIPAGASGVGVKAIVITPGLYINNLKLGDVITLKGLSHQNPLPPSVDRTFKNVTFKEVAVESVAGVFMEREILINRIAEENKLLGKE